MKRWMLVLTIIMTISLRSNTGVPCDFVKKIASPTGGALFTSGYGILTAVGTFVWAFDWSRHAGLSDDDSRTIQETAGMFSVAITLLFSTCVPGLVYLYYKTHPEECPDEENL